MHELQILLLLDPRLACRCVAQAGTFRSSPPAWTRSLNGVAVTSQILCISITLNKRSYNIEFFKSLSAILLPHDIYVKYHFRYRFINNPFSIPYSLFISYFMQLFFLPLLTFIIFVIILKFVFIVLNTQYQNKFLE